MPDRYGMHDPDLIDPPDQPFSYFANPNDILGAFGAPVASEVTPEGYVYTGFGELMFFLGMPPRPTWQRHRTLYRGCLPAVEYELEQDGVRYRFQMFAADLGGGLQGLPLNLVRVTATNLADEPRAAYFSTAWRFRGPVNTAYTSLSDFRFGQRFDNMPEELVAGQTEFDPHWHYRFTSDALVREGRLVYCYPAQPPPAATSLALRDNGLRMVRFFSGEIEGDPDPSYHCDPHSPLGVVTYCLQLAPAESQDLSYKVPIVPLPEDSALADQVRQADYDTLFAETMAFWEDLVVQRAPLRFPERKVQEYLVAGTITNLLAIDHIGGDTITNVNKFHYHDWFGGSDPTHMLRAMDYMGLTDITRDGFLFWRKMQFPDGSFRMHNHQHLLYWELFGWTIWGWTGHYRLTQDRDFLEAIYPGVVEACAWQARVTQADPTGVWPVTTIGDDAFLKDCRQTGQQLWTLVGLKCAIFLAQEMGRTEDAERFQAEMVRFREAFEKALALQTAQTGGRLPPALERTTAGNDWDNLMTLYPEVLFDPFDPRVEATLRHAREQYQEGILRYIWPQAVARDGDDYVFSEQPMLHYWQTPNNTQVSLVRGTAWDQEWAVRELYALLLHTTSTHLPGEFGTVPWSTRECSHCFNILPQGVTIAKTVEVLRNMLVREQDGDLHLLSALSPAWVQPGQRIEVRDAPTAFGPVSMAVVAEDDRLRVSLPNTFRNAPARLWVRIPWFLAVERVEVDGEAVDPGAGEVLVPSGAREMVLYGATRPDTPPLSYEQAVADYKTEYRRRWEHFRRTGERLP
ncbi:MAG: hypothetical protein HPY69_07835 [Armatimonadetes bacterium]|nr:hypothetical protein [Armatimonadota bacterium]